MKAVQPSCKSLGCTLTCYAKTFTGAVSLVSGIAMLFTLWLIPVGLVLAFVGMAMIDPEQPCV